MGWRLIGEHRKGKQNDITPGQIFRFGSITKVCKA